MIMLYQSAASESGIVVGTGNKVEDFGVGLYKVWRWWCRYFSNCRSTKIGSKNASKKTKYS